MGSGEHRAEKMGGLDDCIADNAGVVPTQQPFVGRDSPKYWHTVKYCIIRYQFPTRIKRYKQAFTLP